MRAVCGLTLLLVAMGAPAWAQSGTGVSVSLVGDIIRTDGTNIEPLIARSPERDGEALGFSLRVDRALGSRWGVELEYVRGGELESSGTTLVPEITFLTVGGLNLPSQLTLPYVPREIRSSYKSRLSTVSTLGWFRQSIGERTALIYSAGIAFGVSETEYTTNYIGLPNQNTLPAYTQDYTSYSVNPIVGLDARVKMTEHASLVPGIRVVGAQGGIIVRPSVGLRWEF